MQARGAGQQSFIAAARSCLASAPSWHQTAATRPPSSWPGAHLVSTRSRECDIFLLKKINKSFADCHQQLRDCFSPLSAVPRGWCLHPFVLSPGSRWPGSLLGREHSTGFLGGHRGLRPCCSEVPTSHRLGVKPSRAGQPPSGGCGPRTHLNPQILAPGGVAHPTGVHGGFSAMRGHGGPQGRSGLHQPASCSITTMSESFGFLGPAESPVLPPHETLHKPLLWEHRKAPAAISAPRPCAPARAPWPGLSPGARWRQR